jgi:hypothetical protein
LARRCYCKPRTRASCRPSPSWSARSEMVVVAGPRAVAFGDALGLESRPDRRPERPPAERPLESAKGPARTPAVTPRLQAWRTDRNYGKWHIWLKPAPTPLCGQQRPNHAILCDLSEALHGVNLTQMCSRCLIAFALLDEGAALTPTPESR